MNTEVKTIDLELDAWDKAPGADSIIQTDTKPNVFSKNNTDLSFLEEEEDGSKKESGFLQELDAELNLDDDGENIDTSSKGRPKTDKSGLVNFLKKRIESKEMFAFDDYDESKQTLDDYLVNLSEKDVDDLWTANVDNLKNEVASKTPQEFFNSLPDELQYAAKYVADGGQDLKGLFKVLAQVEENKSLSPKDDAETIAYNYLKATRFGDEDEIKEQIEEWKDLGTLEKKTEKFKPKLDQMQEEVVQMKLVEQEQYRLQQEKAAEYYVNNVFEALKEGEISGLKLDRKTQMNLYNGLIQTNYQSISGRNTNKLGYLLEQYQFGKAPNHGLIAEALWLLENPEAYREEIRKQGDNRTTEKTVKTLKTEQSRKNQTGSFENQDTPLRKLDRGNKNFFKR